MIAAHDVLVSSDELSDEVRTHNLVGLQEIAVEDRYLKLGFRNPGQVARWQVSRIQQRYGRRGARLAVWVK
jgi:hypothetical protein